MRYRRLGLRYAVVFATHEPRPSGDAWRADRPGMMLAQTRWRPPADIYETASHLCITVELAGVDQDEIDVLLFEDAVVVEGDRRLAPDDHDGVYHAAEIRQGSFRLELPLPMSIDHEQVEARYDQGLLRMTFTKRGRG